MPQFNCTNCGTVNSFTEEYIRNNMGAYNEDLLEIAKEYAILTPTKKMDEETIDLILSSKRYVTLRLLDEIERLAKK
jgi:hypothetical protein